MNDRPVPTCRIIHVDLKSLIALQVRPLASLRVCRDCRNAVLSVTPQQPVYERHECCRRKTTKPQAETRKCPAKFADRENLRGSDAVRRDARCDPACAPAFDPDEIKQWCRDDGPKDARGDNEDGGQVGQPAE